MTRRTVLTSRQRSALFSLPEHEAELLRHYTLSDEDLGVRSGRGRNPTPRVWTPRTAQDSPYDGTSEHVGNLLILLGVKLTTIEQHVDSQPQRAPTAGWSSWNAHGRYSWVPAMA